MKKNDDVKNDVFAEGLGFYKLFWVFLFGCVVGVLVETLYCLILGGNFEVRWGVIYGPFNPVYGFGTVIATLLLTRFSRLSNFRVFVFSMLIGGSYEYVCSFFQEMTLGAVSWSYEGRGLNLDGRTSLTYSLCWGFMGLIWLKKVYPKISKWVESFPVKLGKTLTWVLLVFMTFNMLISTIAVWRYSKRVNGIPPRNRFEIFLDRNYNDSVLRFVYPNMRVVKR